MGYEGACGVKILKPPDTYLNFKEDVSWAFGASGLGR